MTDHDTWPTFLGDRRRTGASAGVLTPPLQLSWRRELPGNYLWAGAAIAGNVVYYSSGLGLHALKLEDGAVLWHVPDVIIHGAGSPTLAGDVLLAAGYFHVHAIELESGIVRWRYPSEKLISHCSPAVIGGTLFWGNGAGLLHATDLETGALKWTFQAGPGWLYFAPSVRDGTVYLGTEGAGVYALDAISGKPRWRRKFTGSMSSCNSAAISNGTLFVAVSPSVGVSYGALYALDTETGETIWRHPILYGPRTPPTVKDGVVFVGSGKLYAVSAEGEAIYISAARSNLSHSAPVIAGDHIFVGGGNDFYVYAFDRHNGEKVWEYRTRDMVYSTPAVASGRMLIGCHNGFLYCFEEAAE